MARDLGHSAVLALTLLVGSTVLATPPSPPSGSPGTAISSAGAMDGFERALVRVARREPGAVARIVVFGDSHIAADGFTGALRRRLQLRHGDAGHGFVLLGRAWPLYRHMDVRHGAHRAWVTRRLRERDRTPVRYGLGGARSTARVGGAVAWVATARGGPVGRSAARFEILYERTPGGGVFAVRLDGSRVALVDTDAPAPAAGVHVVEARDGAHHLEIETVGSAPVTLHGAILERAGPGIVVDSLGVPATVSTTIERSDPELLAAHLRRRSPDLVVWAFGTNDLRYEGLDLASYRRRVAKMVGKLRDWSGGSSCLLLGPIDRVSRRSDGAWRASLDEIVDLQRGAAADAGCAFFDQRAAMGGPGSMARWMLRTPPFTLRDGVHLSPRGYDSLAGSLLRALLGAGQGG